MLKISVIIPTYNRSDYIKLTIESFLSQTYDKNNIEIIICDNCSTDNTKKVVFDLIEFHKDREIRYIYESRQGSHFARNTAAQCATGEILYFTDDDMIADSRMLEYIVKIFMQYKDIGAVTGKVIPKWETKPPIWVEKYLNNQWLSLIDKNMKLCITDYDLGVYSCHEAIRSELFLESGGFHPDIIGKEWVGDGETGFNKELQEKGYLFAYVGDAVTEHIIPPTRMTQQYLNRRLYNQGCSDSYTAYRVAANQGRAYPVTKTKYVLPLLKRWIQVLFQVLRRKNTIRFMLAFTYCYKARKNYDYKILKDDAWRKMVLRRNWLKENEN